MKSRYPFRLEKYSENDHRIIWDDGQYVRFKRAADANMKFSDLIRLHFAQICKDSEQEKVKK